MTQDVAVVTAADAGYFDLLVDLVRSLRDKPQGAEVPICVLDLGLRADQLARLQGQVQQIRQVGWDIDFPQRSEQPEHFKAMVARPFLPRHFPGYRSLLWLDADLWVQDWQAIDCFLLAERRHGFAIVPALDRAYAYLYNRGNVRRMNHSVLSQGFGPQAAEALAALPILNSGAFVLRSDAPLWQAWQEALTHALQRLTHHMIEQTALNVAAYAQRPLPQLLPARFNWMCVHALPALDRATGCLVEPFLPHDVLGIVHLGGRIKQQPEAALALTDGGTQTVPLTYRAFMRFRAELAAAASPPSRGS